MYELIYGTEPYLKDQAIMEKKAGLCFSEFNLLETDRYDSEAELFLFSEPFQNDRKVMILYVDGLSDIPDSLISALKDIPDTSVLSIVPETTDRREKAFKAFEKNSQRFDKVSPSNLSKFILREVQRNRVNITRDAMSELTKRLSYEDEEDVSLYTVKNAVRQLSFSGDITVETIEKLIAKRISDSVFELTDHILMQKGEKAMELTETLLKEKAGILILSTILQRFRVAFKASFVRSAEEIGVSAFVYDKAKSISRSLADKAMSLLELSIERIKEGENEKQTVIFCIRGLLELLKQERKQ